MRSRGDPVPKPKHRRPSIREQHWLPWAVTAVAVAFVLALSVGKASLTWLIVPMFALFLLAFFAGSVSGAFFLARPAVVQPQGASLVHQPQLTSGASPARTERPSEAVSVVPARKPPPRPIADTPAFASSEDDKMLQIAVLISLSHGPLDPADGAAPITSELVDLPKAIGESGGDLSVWLPEPGPYPGSVLATEAGDAPQIGYGVKGNTRSMLYHTTQSPYFARTKASVWFRSIADAERAGFAAWNHRALTS